MADSFTSQEWLHIRNIECYIIGYDGIAQREYIPKGLTKDDWESYGPFSERPDEDAHQAAIDIYLQFKKGTLIKSANKE